MGGSGGAPAASTSSGTTCASVTDCPAPASACETSICVGGVCGSLAVNAGTVLAEQVPGDCQELSCDGAGHVETSPDAAGTACSVGSGNVCDGNGQCVECLEPLDCPGDDTACVFRTCENHQCGIALAPFGPTPEQVGGDCLDRRCDAAGNVVNFFDPSDLEDDGIECTVDACMPAGTTHEPKPTGTPCSQGDGHLCDAATCMPYLPFVCVTDVGSYAAGSGEHEPWYVQFAGIDGITYQCNEGPCYCKQGNSCKVVISLGVTVPGTCQPIM